MAVNTQHQAPAFEGLLFNVFQQLRQVPRPAGGLAIAFSSANSGEGVTYIIQALLASLGRDASGRTLLADSRHLRGATASPAQLIHCCRPLVRGSARLFEFVPDSARQSSDWDASWQYRRDSLDQLRSHFDYILLDCPALRESNDLLSVAPFVDGVLLVVEAGRTRRDQILHAEKAIEFARGKLLGHVLNKRRYVVPEWLYRRL